MKIIKEGNLKLLDKTRRFTCGDCGCVWLANAAEYRTEFERNCEYYVCECPTCGHNSHNSEKAVTV